MWRANGSAFFGLFVFDNMLSILAIIWTFKLIPSIAFCVSPADVCSCTGGGFEIFEFFCMENSTKMMINDSQPENSSRSSETIVKAKEQYKGFIESLEGNTASILASIAVVCITILVFTLARVYMAYIRADDTQALVESENAKLREQNMKIKGELKAHRFTLAQSLMVNANRNEIEDEVSPHLKLNWENIKFEERLGSGAFGDCFKGSKGGRPVAVSSIVVI